MVARVHEAEYNMHKNIWKWSILSLWKMLCIKYTWPTIYG